jgi:hypothetical protein
VLSPFATHHILKHFNAIDEAVTGKLLYKRPRDEEDITKSLVDALDEECQVQEKIAYRIDQLRNDLLVAGEPTFVDLNVETHTYTKHWERYVSQADLGIIVRYQNYYEPRLSKSWSWLLQAKRVFPITGLPTKYGAGSKFESFDPDQHKRIKKLVKFVDADFFRYLLYCPRPSLLENSARQELAYCRGAALNDKIFDFAHGLELRDDLRDGSPTIAAGIFISKIDPFPKNLGEVHREIFHNTIPFSWFLLDHIPARGSHLRYEDDSLPTNQDNQIAQALVEGKAEVIDEIMTRLEDREFNLKLLPSATITVTVSQGNKNVMALQSRS